MTTDKKNIQALSEVCRIMGISEVVCSPGSRSAPLVIAFSSIKEMRCTVIPDERAAGFFALGIAQLTRSTVAVVCTSGTAALNLAPAVCEAYHQQLPLLLITADRPAEYIGTGENQAINQQEIYRNYIRASFTLPEVQHEAARITAEAISLTTHGSFSPVHINVPLREPLYGTSNEDLPDFTFSHSSGTMPEGKQTLSTGKRNLILCGMSEPDAPLLNTLHQLSLREDIAIIAEPLSNMPLPFAVSNPDAAVELLASMPQPFYPEVVISMGGQFVSKRLRQFLKTARPERHYHISTDRGEWNGLSAQSFVHICASPHEKLQALLSERAVLSDYARIWKAISRWSQKSTESFARLAPFSDWQVIRHLVQTFPEGACIQYGNSSPVRYAGFFRHHSSLKVNSNRGTSGIDGCLSTAVGAAFAAQRLTIALIGDISFFYDSNALWNNYLSPQLRIIVINNSGGNIFRLIDGPGTVQRFEEFFETRHHLNAEHLAAMYGIPYYFCDKADDLSFVLGQFYGHQKGNRPAILEVKTDPQTDEETYKNYFEFLRKESIQ